METVKDFNVYNKISRGEHVCRGDKLYLKEDMKKMLSESGLSLAEMKMLYKLNAEAAWIEVEKMAEEDFLTVQPTEQIYLSATGWLPRVFHFFEREHAAFCIMMVIQILGILICTICAIRYSEPNFFVPILFVLVSYLLAIFITGCLDRTYHEKARHDSEVPEDHARKRLKTVVENRQRMMNSVCNTLHMYECMDEYIKNSSREELIIPVEDDLK